MDAAYEKSRRGESMGTIRLDKLLAASGAGTRSEVKNFIRKGRVTVNGTVCKNADSKADAESDVICLDGQPVFYSEFEYHVLYKPAGCVTAARDARYETVMDYITSARKKDLFPVGRLDLDTEGLLLITNDGDLAHRLLAPGKHVDKTYFARVQGEVTPEDIARFQDGLDIGEDRPTMPAVLEILSVGEISEVYVTIQEGKFHQIKRMFAAVGKTVLYLKRLRMGSLVLDPALQAGESRLLSQKEIDDLRKGAAHE